MRASVSGAYASDPTAASWADGGGAPWPWRALAIALAVEQQSETAIISGINLPARGPGNKAART